MQINITIVTTITRAYKKDITLTSINTQTYEYMPTYSTHTSYAHTHIDIIYSGNYGTQH